VSDSKVVTTKTMMTFDLSGIALDWAVAKCEGFASIARGISEDGNWYFVPAPAGEASIFSPTKIGAQGGVIARREWIFPTPAKGGEFVAYKWVGDDKCFESFGSTPLEASMRCYVESKLGSVVEIPYELIDNDGFALNKDAA